MTLPPAPRPARHAVSPAPLAAVAGAGFLVLLKAAGARATGSLALGAAALDSLLDVFISATGYLVLRRSAAPPDADHAYGHGKFENLAALGQGVLLTLGAGGLVVAAVGRLRSGVAPEQSALGVAVLAVSLAVSFWIARHLRRAAATTESPALHADSIHYGTDLWVNGAALAALLIEAATGWAPADPLVALAVAGLLLRSAAGLVLEEVGELSDRGLPEGELRRIREIVAAFRPQGVVGLHDLRTRRSGGQRFIELHLEIDRDTTFVDAHDLMVRVLRAIESELPRSKVFVHGDPVEPGDESPGYESSAP